jgi:hypothetical protein
MRESTPLPFPAESADPATIATIATIATVDRDRSALQIKLIDDPWSLTHQERLDLRATLAAAQVAWLRRIEDLVEPPAIDDAFPAFLLATAPFAHLGHAIGDARSPTDLDTGTADALQRFVDRYRSFLTGE